MKIKKLIANEKGSSGAFIWTVIIFTFLFIMLVWTALYDGIVPMMQYAIQTNNALPAGQQDPMLPYMILIIDLFPLWLMIGLTIVGLSRSQKKDEGDY